MDAVGFQQRDRGMCIEAIQNLTAIGCYDIPEFTERIWVAFNIQPWLVGKPIGLLPIMKTVQIDFQWNIMLWRCGEPLPRILRYTVFFPA